MTKLSSPGFASVGVARLLSWDWFAKPGRARVKGPSHKKTNIRVFTERERGQSGPAYIWRAGPLRYCRFCRIPESSVSLIKRKTRFPFLLLPACLVPGNGRSLLDFLYFTRRAFSPCAARSWGPSSIGMNKDFDTMKKPCGHGTEVVLPDCVVVALLLQHQPVGVAFS